MKNTYRSRENIISKIFEKLSNSLKISIFLILTLNIQATVAASSNPPGKSITLELKNASIDQVFQAIQEQTNYVFLFSKEMLGINEIKEVSVKDASINKVLDIVFKGTDIEYKIVGNRVIISTTSFDQQELIEIQGKVLDETGSPLPGVSIIILGSSNGTTTDFDGNYTIEASKGDVLTFSFMGYSTKEVIVESNTLNVTLQPDSKLLGDVIVVGYGVQKKSVVTGAISSISSEDISKTSVASTSQALQGQTSGVTVLPSSGSPGAPTKIRIRGAGSNGNSDPIYVVDGMKTRNIDFLDPSDIKSMEVLKDAASASIYGSDGGNGVIMITTKQGKKGTLNVSYNMQYGIQDVRHQMDMMNADQYSTWIAELNPAGEKPNPDDWKGKQGTNWQDEVFQTAPMQKHNLSVSGGNEISTFMLSATYFTQDGVVGGDASKFDRSTFRINSNHKISKWLEVGNSFSYANSKKKSIDEDNSFGGLLSSTLSLDPTTPTVYENGSALPAHVQSALDAGHTLLKDDNGAYFGLSNYVSGKIVNPLATLSINNGLTTTDKIFGNAYVNITPLEGLTVTSRIGLDLSYSKYDDYTNKYWFNSEYSNAQNNKIHNNTVSKYWLWENFASYTKQINKHNFTLLLGMSSQETSYEWMNSTAAGMIKEEPQFMYYGNASIDGLLSGNKIESSQYSYFARLSYNYDEKYLFQAVVRNDNSSLFAPGKRSGVFPSVSAGWVMSNENFWNVEQINNLKLRASWGQNGSTANINPGQYLALITKDGLKVPNASETGYFTAGELLGLPNDGLTWETTEQLDLGFDLRAFNDRLSIGFDYYKKVTTDLLTPSSPPPHLGYNAPYANAGDVTNKGIEIDLGWRERKGDFGYSANINLTTLNNEVTYLNPFLSRVNGAEAPLLGTVTYFEEGLPVWYYRGYKTDGIFQNQQEIDDYKANVLNNPAATYNPKPGDPKVVDENGNGDIDAGDQTYIGDPHPDFMIGGVFSADYKGFDFRLFLQGAFGQENFLAMNRIDRATSNRPEYFFTDRWTGEGSTNTGFRPQASNEYVYKSDLMVKDGSYLKIKQIQFGYTVNKDVLSKIGLKNARVFVSLDDYFTFTNYVGIDPEVGSFNNNSQGVDRGYYPVPGRFMMGLSVMF